MIVRFRRGNMTETRPVHGKLDHHVSAGRKRDGYQQLPVSVEFTKYGNTLFRPVYVLYSRSSISAFLPSCVSSGRWPKVSSLLHIRNSSPHFSELCFSVDNNVKFLHGTFYGEFQTHHEEFVFLLVKLGRFLNVSKIKMLGMLSVVDRQVTKTYNKGVWRVS